MALFEFLVGGALLIAIEVIVIIRFWRSTVSLDKDVEDACR